MKIAVITKREKAEKSGSVMAEAAGLLRAEGHEVESVYPEELLTEVASVQPEADLYLLKSGTEMALSLAGVLDAAGAEILNPYSMVVAMRDKIISTRMLADAGVPLPETFFTARADKLAECLGDGPLVIKPFWAASQGRGVRIVRTVDELGEISPEDGIVFAQRYHQPDGRDYKLYVIGTQVFGVRRVWPPKTLEDKLGEPFEVSDEMRQIALNCGAAFGIGLYGVDVITSGGRPFVVDINTFPGFKGVPGAARLLADFILNIQ